MRSETGPVYHTPGGMSRSVIVSAHGSLPGACAHHRRSRPARVQDADHSSAAEVAPLSVEEWSGPQRGTTIPIALLPETTEKPGERRCRGHTAVRSSTLRKVTASPQTETITRPMGSTVPSRFICSLRQAAPLGSPRSNDNQTVSNRNQPYLQPNTSGGVARPWYALHKAGPLPRVVDRALVHPVNGSV